MHKRGQGDDWLKYIIMLIVAGAIMIFGYTSVTGVATRSCQSEVALFIQQVAADVEAVYGAEGSVIEKSYALSCGFEKVYFFDHQQIDVSNYQEQQNLKDFPLVLEELEGDTGRNMFLYSGGQLQTGASAGDVFVDFPYFTCFKPSAGGIKVFYRGVEGRVEVRPADERFSCNPLVLVEDKPVEEQASILEEALGEGGDCYFEHKIEKQKGKGAADKGNDVEKKIRNLCTEEDSLGVEKKEVEIKRTIRVNEDTGQTKVNLIIKSKGKDKDKFFYIERFPKTCVERLQGIITIDESLHLAKSKVLQKDDPLLMWSFGKLEEDAELKFGYSLNTPLSEECQRAIDSVAFSVGGRGRTPNSAQFKFKGGDGDDGTTLGEPETLTEDGPTIGEGTFVHNKAKLHPSVVLGANGNVEQGVDLKKNVEIGDDFRLIRDSKMDDGSTAADGFALGRNAHIQKEVEMGNKVKIERDVKVGDETTMGDDITIGDRSDIKKRVTIESRVIIEDDVTIEDGATIRAGTTVPAGTTVDKDAIYPAGSAGRPDLEPSNLRTTLIAGRNVGFAFDAANKGTKSVSAFKYKFEGGNFNNVVTATVGIAAGGSTVVSVPFVSFPSSGSQAVNIILDPLKEIDEIKEDNNVVDLVFNLP